MVFKFKIIKYFPLKSSFKSCKFDLFLPVRLRCTPRHVYKVSGFSSHFNSTLLRSENLLRMYEQRDCIDGTSYKNEKEMYTM